VIDVPDKDVPPPKPYKWTFWDGLGAIAPYLMIPVFLGVLALVLALVNLFDSWIGIFFFLGFLWIIFIAVVGAIKEWLDKK
jgi:hypothetical protein